jgi:hypothetical protein
MESSANKFNDGLIEDLNPRDIPNESYEDSLNGQLIYNDVNNYNWVVANGNKASFTITPNGGTISDKYTPIGGVGNTDIKILFSVDEVNGFSEIGIFSINEEGEGQYKTLYNDFSDISQTLGSEVPILKFNSFNQITARFLYENDELIRVYWVDGVASNSNPPRVFTFKYTDAPSGRSDVNNYSAITISAHSINIQAEFSAGIIKYVKRISGNCLAGVYQYTYRLLTADGYPTPWTTPTRRSFLTTDAINSIDWSLYEMDGSGVATPWGNEIEIKGIDTRYEKIQVAYIYSQTDLEVDETTIFAEEDINDRTVINFLHQSMSGEPVVAETIGQIFTGIKAAKTLDSKDAAMYFGNIHENITTFTDQEYEDVVQNVIMQPIFRKMRSDEVLALSVDNSPPPLTNQTPKTQSSPAVPGFVKRLHDQSGGAEFYELHNDYVNYKGTQVDKEFSGYFRGETYRFALQIYDTLGFPVFAIHLGDFRFPEQTSLDYEFTRLRSDGTLAPTVNGSLGGSNYPWTTDNYNAIAGTDLWNEDVPTTQVSKIRIMGLEIGGINISGIKDRISGFSIVRVDRDKTILAQGMVLPGVRDILPSGGPTPYDTVRPFPGVVQRWYPPSAGSTATLVDADNENDNALLGPERETAVYQAVPRVSVMYSPDYTFDQSFIPSPQDNDTLKIVGGSFSEKNITPPNFSSTDALHFTYYESNDRANGGMHAIVKQYYTKNEYHRACPDPFPRYLSEAAVKNQIIADIGEIKYDAFVNISPVDTNTYTIDNNQRFFNDEFQGFYSDSGGAGNPSEEMNGKEMPCVYYLHENFIPNGGGNPEGVLPYAPFFAQTENPLGTTYHHGALTVNYYRENLAPYGGISPSSLEQSIFYSTGHFQPVNNSEFTTPANDIFNGIEVWGGDCYLDYYTFLRTYPRWTQPSGNKERDYAVGVSCPIESVLNFTMRQAPSASDPIYSHLGARPEQSTTTAYSGGLYHVDATDKLQEEFNLNASFLYRELLKFSFTRPIGFENIYKFPTRWRYSDDKFYGSNIDSWRLFQTNWFQDMNGSYGAITSSEYFFNQIYSFQESAFGRLRARDRQLIDSSTGALTTGVGDKLDGIDYISTKYGNQHQFSMVNSGNSLYWIDVDKRKAMRFAQDGKLSLSDMRGLHTFFKYATGYFYNKDSPAAGEGICGGYDYGNNQLYWTFNRDYYRPTAAAIFVDSENIKNPDYYSQNTTIMLNGTGGAVIFPETTFVNSENKATVYYIAVDPDSTNPVEVQNGVANPPSTNTIATANAGEFWEISRGNAGESWVATQVQESDITTPRYTVSYNEDLNRFISYYSFKPTFYIPYKDLLVTHDKDFPNIGNEMFVEDRTGNNARYYGVNYKSLITLSSQDNPYFSKTFDNIRLSSNREANDKFSRYLYETDTQKYYFDLANDTRRKYLEDTVRMPIRKFDQKDRTRGKYVTQTFEFKNNDNKPVELYNLITNYRVSNRI